MQLCQLNLKVLRALSSRKPQEEHPPYDWSGILHRKLSRRAFLEIGAGTGLSTIPGVRSLIPGVGRLEVRKQPDGLIIYYDGLERFAIRPRDFSGKPKLSIASEKDSIAATLRQSRFPGSDLAADMDFELWNTPLGWRVRVELLGIGFIGHGYVDEWFQANPLSGRCVAKHKLIDAPSTQVSLYATYAQFGNEWTLRFPDEAVASVELGSQKLLLDNLVLKPSPASNASVLRNAPKRLTIVEAERGGHSWFLKPPSSKAEWDIEDESDFFDQITLEISETARGNKRLAFIARRNQRRPHPKIISAAMPQGLVLNTANERYAFVPSEGGEQSFLADLAPVARHLPLGPLQLALTNPTNTPAITINCHSNTTDAMISPACAIKAGFPGDIVASDSIPSFASIPLNFRKALVEVGGALATVPRAIIELWPRGTCLKGTFAFSITRPTDFLDLVLEFRNARVQCGWFEEAHLRPQDPTKPTLMIAHFSPQAVAEIPYAAATATEGDETCMVYPPGSLTQTGSPPPTPISVSGQRPIEARYAQPSRVVFQIFPANQPNQRMPLKLEHLLNWATLPIIVHSDGQTWLDTETSLEMPYGLVLSPSSQEKFLTRVQPRKNPYTERYEIWSAQLSNANDAATVRALANRLNYNDAFDCAVDPIQGFNDLVTLSKPAQDGTPAVDIVVSPLVLTSRGGYLSAAMKTERLDARSLTVFQETITDARENLEKLSYEGFLLPTGHKVLLEFTKKRQWCSDPTEGAAAYEIERIKIKFIEQTVDYSNWKQWINLPPINPDAVTRQIPFKTIHVPLSETPTLEFIDARDYILEQGQSPPTTACSPPRSPVHHPCSYPFFYWPVLAGSVVKYAFPMEFTDFANKKTKTKIPLMFVMAGLVRTRSVLDDVTHRYRTGDLTGLCTLPNAYNSAPDTTIPNVQDYQVCDFAGQKIAFAPASQAKPTDTTFNTRLLGFSVQDLTSYFPNPDQALLKFFAQRVAPWCPSMAGVQLDIEAVRRFAQANSLNSSPYTVMKYDSKTYVPHGFPAANSDRSVPNRGEVFLEAISGPTLSFNGSLSGGIATPTANTSGLSRKLGTIPGTPGNGSFDAVATGQFSPTTSYSVGASIDESTLLGVLPLAQIFAPIADVIDELQKVPKLISQDILDLESELAEVQDDIATVQQAIQQIQFLAQQSIDNILNAPAFAKVLNTISIVELCVRILVRGEVTLLPALAQACGSTDGTIPAACLPASVQAQIAAAQKQAQLAVGQVLSDLNCSGAATLPQVRDCVIALAVQQGVSTQAYQVMSSYVDLGITELFSVAEAVNSVVGAVSSNPWVELARNLYSLAQQVAKGAPPATLLTTLSSVVDAADRVPDLSQVASDVNTAITSAIANVNAAITDSLGTIATEKARIETAINTVATQALSLNNVHLDVSTAISAADQVISTTSTYINSFNNASAQWQKDLQAAVQPILQFAAQVTAAAQSIDDLVGTIEGVLAQIQIPKQITTSYEVNPDLEDVGPFIASRDGNDADMSISTTVTAYLDGTPPASDVVAFITDFTVSLFPAAPFLSVGFKSLKFEAKNSLKPVISADVSQDDIAFLGVLNFVEKLQDFIQFPGDDGPTIQVTTSGIFVGISISIPSIESGAFDLSNISFSAGVSLSFDGSPALVQFSFAQPNDRFLLAYGIFGGGGFLTFQAGLDGIRSLQAALEFGAVLALDLGVAEGDAHAFGGFYFDSSPQMATLRGYLRVGGELDILDVVTMSVEFFLGLAYESRGGQAWVAGDCEITVEVDVLFFSASVDLHMHREFSGQSA